MQYAFRWRRKRERERKKYKTIKRGRKKGRSLNGPSRSGSFVWGNDIKSRDLTYTRARHRAGIISRSLLFKRHISFRRFGTPVSPARWGKWPPNCRPNDLVRRRRPDVYCVSEAADLFSRVYRRGGEAARTEVLRQVGASLDPTCATPPASPRSIENSTVTVHG